MFRKWATLPVLALALSLGAAVLVALAQPLTNPSTITIWNSAGWGSYKDTTMIGASSSDTAQYCWGFEARKITYLNYGKTNQIRWIGKSTLTAAATRSKVPSGITKNQPVFNSTLYKVPANFGETFDPTGCRGVKISFGAAADTFYIRAYK